MTAATPIRPAAALRTESHGRGTTCPSEAELIAQVLAGPEPAADVLRWGEALAPLPFWERRGLGVHGLVRHHGVPPRHAARLVALWELAERWFPDERPTITCPRDAVLHLSRTAQPGMESMTLLLLDSQHHVLGVEMLAAGNACLAHLQPRQVLHAALRSDAASIVVAHCNPRGDASPSHIDRRIAMQQREAAALLGLPLLDYILIGRRGLYSFAQSDGWTDAQEWTTDDDDSCY